MLELKQILCPVDFSDPSRHAVEHAVVFARWYGSRIVGLHVFQPLFVPVPGFELAGYQSAEVSDQVARALDPEVLKRDVEAVLCAAKTAGVPTEARVEMGAPAKRIVECAAALPADLIVMGTHGAGGFEHLVLGSVTEKVMRQARCPVLTVPPRSHATSAVPVKRLLCPVDFSEASIRALRAAISLAEEGDADITILHVLESPLDYDPLPTRSYTVPDYATFREEAAVERLEALVPEEARDWCRPTFRLAHGKSYVEILGAAAEGHADLIVMGVHGRNALDIMLFGSTTNQVVRRSTCPVLTLRD
jgi:nucleotide-binding universal stress UspA family protein